MKANISNAGVNSGRVNARIAGHVTGGHWDWRTSLALALAVFVGGQIGSRISVGLDKNKLKKGFGWFLLAIAAMMFARLWLSD